MQRRLEIVKTKHIKGGSKVVRSLGDLSSIVPNMLRGSNVVTGDRCCSQHRPVNFDRRCGTKESKIVTDIAH